MTSEIFGVEAPGTIPTVTTEQIVEEKLDVTMTPGAVVEMTPDEADVAGAFPDDALSFEDALEASLDAGE